MSMEKEKSLQKREAVCPVCPHHCLLAEGQTGRCRARKNREGKIVSIKEETCVIETTHERTKIRILKTAISRVDVKAEDAAD